MLSSFELLSSIIGWLYFAAWSLSFYPQVILNFQRKSVVGLSFDFIALNLWGFVCYTIFNAAFYFNEEVRKQYRDKWGSDNVVQINDVFFGVHACVITVVTIAQAMVYQKSVGQTVSPKTYGFILLTAYGAVILGLDSYFGSAQAIDVLYYLSFVKMAITLIKYIPQAYLNYKRKSTFGWSIGNILLDFSGGTLSIIQQVMDSSITGDWSGILGNPVKFSLGLISISFDILFMIQHYVLYPHGSLHDEEDPLISHRD
ncbi:hypothetical protein HDU97_001762 [Phlyctochytrium planicorne]|nr:hypothetical protein HDU97_001762 [Phlyctochytrium planicorne]